MSGDGSASPLVCHESLGYALGSGLVLRLVEKRKQCVTDEISTPEKGRARTKGVARNQRASQRRGGAIAAHLAAKPLRHPCAIRPPRVI